MSRSGQRAGRPSLATSAAVSSGQSADSGLAVKATLGLVGLGVLGHVLRGIGQESRANTFARQAAWNKRQVQLLERKAERQSAHLALKAERQAGRLERKARRAT
jgi:hypothetical protein